MFARILCKIFGHKKSKSSKWVQMYRWGLGANGKFGRWPDGRFVPCCSRCNATILAPAPKKEDPPFHPMCKCVIDTSWEDEEYLPATTADRFRAALGWLKRIIRITTEGKES